MNDHSEMIAGGQVLSSGPIENRGSQVEEDILYRETSVVMHRGQVNGERHISETHESKIRILGIGEVKFNSAVNKPAGLEASGGGATPTRLPQGGLFQEAPQGQTSYLIETNPLFTEQKYWLGTDYMISHLLKPVPTDLSPSQESGGLSFEEIAFMQAQADQTSKRLGDGFYEQRLVREQIYGLTGQRYLEGYSDDPSQFQALMDNGINYATAQQLRPGMASFI